MTYNFAELKVYSIFAPLKQRFHLTINRKRAYFV